MHPQANGIAEVTNQTILEGLKRRVTGTHRAWVDELPNILCASQTTPKTPMGESPFSLTFDTEAILPPEMVYTNLRVEYYEEPTSFNRLRENLNLLKERRVKAHLRAFTYKKIVARLYDYRVRPQ
ncbi:hypothetical protein GW17_00050247 [Ensete ventricosum]|nr:hypothetical protein GW17_00050247 [Ensete ventricosum]